MTKEVALLPSLSSPTKTVKGFYPLHKEMGKILWLCQFGLKQQKSAFRRVSSSGTGMGRAQKAQISRMSSLWLHLSCFSSSHIWGTQTQCTEIIIILLQSRKSIREVLNLNCLSWCRMVAVASGSFIKTLFSECKYEGCAQMLSLIKLMLSVGKTTVAKQYPPWRNY